MSSVVPAAVQTSDTAHMEDDEVTPEVIKLEDEAYGGAPAPPTVTVLETRAFGAVLSIVKAQGSTATVCKLEHRPASSAATTPWVSQTLRFCTVHSLSPLASLTDYVVRVSLENQHGWGSCTTVRLQTAKYFVLADSKAQIFMDGYLRMRIRVYEQHLFDQMVATLIHNYLAVRMNMPSPKITMNYHDRQGAPRDTDSHHENGTLVEYRGPGSFVLYDYFKPGKLVTPDGCQMREVWCRATDIRNDQRKPCLVKKKLRVLGQHRHRKGKKKANQHIARVLGQHIVREIKLLKHLDRQQASHTVTSLVMPCHPNQENTFTSVCMVMPGMDVDLGRVLRSRQQLSDRHVLYFVYQILCGLACLHSANIVHRNLVCPYSPLDRRFRMCYFVV